MIFGVAHNVGTLRVRFESFFTEYADSIKLDNWGFYVASGRGIVSTLHRPFQIQHVPSRFNSSFDSRILRPPRRGVGAAA